MRYSAKKIYHVGIPNWYSSQLESSISRVCKTDVPPLLKMRRSSNQNSDDVGYEGSQPLFYHQTWTTDRFQGDDKLNHVARQASIPVNAPTPSGLDPQRVLTTPLPKSPPPQMLHASNTLHCYADSTHLRGQTAKVVFFQQQQTN